MYKAKSLVEMTMPLPIHLATEPVVEAPRGTPLLRLAFRPFYLAGASAAALLMAVWYFVFFGRYELASEISPVLWHAHEMVYGFAVAVVVGFLFTAGKSWTGLETPRGLPLASLVSIWLAGRISGVIGNATVFLFWDIAFLPLVAAVFVHLLVRARNWRNLPIAGVLCLLAGVNVLFHLSAMGVLGFSPMKVLHSSVALVVVLITVMAGRVIPMFTRNAIAGVEISTNPRREQLVLGLTALGLGLWVLSAPDVPTAMVLSLAAAGHLWRLFAWSSLKTWKKPLVWVLHLSYAWMPVAFVLLALACLDVVTSSVGVHALTVGVIGGVIAGMISRTARGHTGRMLTASPVEVLVFLLVPVSALFRVGAGLFGGGAYERGLVISGALWVAAFVLYLLRYAPWLMSARLDGKDG